MTQETPLQKAVSFIIEAGYQIDKEAFDFLKNLPENVNLDPLIKAAVEELEKLPDKPLFINRAILERKAKEFYPPEPAQMPEAVGTTGPRAYAKEIDSEMKVLEDPTEKLSATGSLEEYIEYFQDRFKRLSRIMKQRMDMRDSCTLLETFKAPENSKVKVLCMVTEKREAKSGIFLGVEDPEANATIFVPSKSREILQKAQRLMADQVIGVPATKGKENLLIAEDLILPDVPMKKPNKAPVPVCAALISDLHVGSKMFMKDAFQRFILWLEGKLGNRKLRNLAGHVKYVIVAGDIVDGVGIYPQQIEDLEIADIYKQYEEAAKILEQIPDHIEVVTIPGNHDATRRALPQPAILREYAEPIYESGRIRCLGDPSILSLHGVVTLLSHGRSLDDVISTVPRMSFQMPDEAMKYLLQCRHLAPTYGMRTLIASEKVDHLVIETVPDIFHTGHVHTMRYSTYRGTLLVNSGAWQDQTDYQREMGHIPNPGIVPVVNLQSLEVTPIDFITTV